VLHSSLIACNRIKSCSEGKLDQKEHDQLRFSNHDDRGRNRDSVNIVLGRHAYDQQVASDSRLYSAGLVLGWVTSHLGQLSLPSLQGRIIEYKHVWLGLRPVAGWAFSTSSPGG